MLFYMTPLPWALPRTAAPLFRQSYAQTFYATRTLRLSTAGEPTQRLFAFASPGCKPQLQTPAANPGRTRSSTGNASISGFCGNS